MVEPPPSTGVIAMHHASFAPAVAAIAAALAAFAGDVAPGSPRLTPAALDEAFEATWSELGRKPLGEAPEAEWLRRASLALTGVVPAASEVVAFLEDGSAEKRAKKVDELLARREYAEHWGGEWTTLLVGRGGRRAFFDRDAFEGWMIEQFAQNVPFDRLATALLTATGTMEENPATGYVARWELRPKDLAGQTAKAFLGLQLQCARCHDHKYEQWKQDEFNEFAAHFAGLERQRDPAMMPKDKKEKPYALGVTDAPERVLSRSAKRSMRRNMRPAMKERMDERKELAAFDPTPLRPISSGPLAAPMPPAEPVAGASETQVELTRRQRLAAWMTKPGNPYFARAVVNRAFAGVFGYGLVNPVDDFRSDSTVAIPPLLDLLARELEASGYDLRGLVALLARSRAFAVAGGAKAGESEEDRAEAEKVFARYPQRPMEPEPLFASLLRATGLEERVEQAKGLRQQGLRKFVTTFEDDEEAEEISFEGTIPQALLLMNGQAVTRGVAKGTTIAAAMKQRGAGPRIDWLYLATLSRKPTSEERSKAYGYVSGRGEKREAFEDVLWALLNSAEFSTIH